MKTNMKTKRGAYADLEQELLDSGFIYVNSYYAYKQIHNADSPPQGTTTPMNNKRTRIIFKKYTGDATYVAELRWIKDRHGKPFSRTVNGKRMRFSGGIQGASIWELRIWKEN